MATDILRIDRSKWVSGYESEGYKVGKGEPQLLNKDGYMCCLGFRCNQLGIPKSHLKHIYTPDRLSAEWEIPDLVDEVGTNTDFCDKAMEINDDGHITTQEREKAIKKHFAKKKIKVVFTGKYKYQTIPK